MIEEEKKDESEEESDEYDSESESESEEEESSYEEELSKFEMFKLNAQVIKNKAIAGFKAVFQLDSTAPPNATTATAPNRHENQNEEVNVPKRGDSLRQSEERKSEFKRSD